MADSIDKIVDDLFASPPGRLGQPAASNDWVDAAVGALFPQLEPADDVAEESEAMQRIEELRKQQETGQTLFGMPVPDRAKPLSMEELRATSGMTQEARPPWPFTSAKSRAEDKIAELRARGYTQGIPETLGVDTPEERASTMQGFQEIFKTSAEDLGMSMVYDVAHNIAKLEKHKVDGVNKQLIVHRKGSTRCFGPSRPELPSLYKDSGQPVIVGGSMETGSYLCVGTDKAEETFGSTMHGAGRTMSRTAAKKQVQGQALQDKMEKQNIYVKAVSMSGLAEEAGFAYKNVASVVDVMDKAGISKKVVALRPKGNIKG